MSGDDLGGNEAKTTGAGQSVNVVISSGSVKWLVIAVLAAMALLLFTNHTASKAELKSDTAVHASTEAANELRMVQYWIQRADAECAAKGINLPADPFIKTADK